MKDRNDYRCMSTKQLCEQARYAVNPNWQELAIALTERLEDYHYDVRADYE
jgi:hypothetical protein